MELWQVDPATYENLYTNYLRYHQNLGMALSELRAAGISMDENLVGNLLYGVAVCRLIYHRRPEPLPEAGDIEGQSAFWKPYYNTIFRKETVMTKCVYKVGQILKEAEGR